MFKQYSYILVASVATTSIKHDEHLLRMYLCSLLGERKELSQSSDRCNLGHKNSLQI